MSAMKSPHPMQPVIRGRFKENEIVSFLLDFSRSKGIGLNEIARMPWPKGDYEQLMQLIGYSVDGYEELSMVSEASKKAARILSK